jgi:hypothetical protein
MERFADRFGDIVRGLISLEVNTIIKDGMSATRMGPPAAALCEIAARYATWLQNNGCAYTAVPDPVTPQYLDTLAATADQVKAAHPDSEGVAVMATRIARNARQLSTMFDKLTKTDPEPSELVQLRKIWELGTETVVMQTVLWIDGDATQRIHPAYADQAHQQLLAVHSASVSMSLNYWKCLGDLIVSVFSTAWEKLTTK